MTDDTRKALLMMRIRMAVLYLIGFAAILWATPHSESHLRWLAIPVAMLMGLALFLRGQREGWLPRHSR